MESTIQIEVNVVTKMFRVVDSTDYAAQGVSLATLAAKGLGTVRFNGSIVYQKLLVGDPLVNLATGATTSAWVACPLDGDDNPVYGTYTCDYSVRTALDDEDVLSVTAGTGGAGAFTLDNLDLREVLSVGDTFVISDSLAANSGTKTITSIVFASGDTALFVSGSVNAETPVVSSKLSFDITKATATATAVYAGCTQIVPSFSFDSDCEYGLFGRLSLLDTTDVNGQTIVSRELTLQYPSWTNTADVTSEDGGIVLDALATGTWTITNDYELSQVSSGLIVTYTASVTDERKVSCAGTLCGLLPCIENLLQVHGEAVKRGFSPYQYFVDSISLNYIEAVEYKKCGKFEKYQEKVAAIDELLDASGCECSCCDDDVLIWVVNATSGQATIIEELQAEIDALELRVSTLETEQEDQNTQIETLSSKLVENSLLFVNRVRFQGTATWNDLEFNVPSSIFRSIGTVTSNTCVDIEISGSSGSSTGEYVLRNQTTGGSAVAFFTAGGDRFKATIRLVCSAVDEVSSAIEHVYSNNDGNMVFGDTPIFATCAWDFSEDFNQLKLTCDDEDVQFVDMIKVTTHTIS